MLTRMLTRSSRPYNPWDQGTKGGSPHNSTAAGANDAASLADLLSSTASDGFFGDTISSSGLAEFYADSVKAGEVLISVFSRLRKAALCIPFYLLSAAFCD